jgi:hypothetical protein
MEISTFELLAKPIAPPNLLPAGLVPVARRIVQGYFLSISNLETFTVAYRIQFTISLPVPADANKILLNNAVLLFDVEGTNTSLALTQDPVRPEIYRGVFRIPGRKTASVELLPRLPDVLAASQLEVRGFVSLFRVGPLPVPPQPPTVKVLLNPEIRGTFLPNNFPTPPFPPPTTPLDFDQINYTLAIASGKALNEIPLEPRQPIIIGPIEPILEELRNGTLDLGSLAAENPEKAKMLVQLLAQLDPSEVNLKDLNTVMEKIDIPVRMSSI